MATKQNELNTTDEDTNTELSILDAPVASRTAANPDDINAMVAAMNAAVLDTTDPSFIKSQIETLGSSAFDRVNRERATQVALNTFTQDINEAIEAKQIDRLVELENERQKAIEEVHTSKSPEAITASLSNPETENRMAEAKFNQRLISGQKIINEEIEKATPGIIGGIGDFLDLNISAPFDALQAGGFSRTETAQRLSNLLVADISNEQFENEWRAAIQEAADAGLFTDNNFFYLSSFAENLNQRGKGLEGQLDRFFTVLDAVGVTGTAAIGSARALKAAKNSSSLTSALGGPKAGARVLADAMNDPTDSQKAQAAGVPREGVPSVMRPPENNNGHKLWYLPGMEIGRVFQDENSYLNYVQSLGFSPRIDPKVFAEWKPIGLQRLREEINATKQSRIINLDIDQDRAGNIFGTILFGKKNGMPFTDKGNATKAARDLNGELEPIDQGGQRFWQIRVEKNISAEGLVEPLTSEEIGQVYFSALDDLKLLGGSFLTLPERLTTLSLRGEGVFARGAKDISKRFQKKLEAVPKKEVEVLQRTIHQLRDGEHAFSRSWYNEGTFISEFAKNSGGQNPSQAAIDLYFEAQEISDSFYMLKADQIFKKAVDKGYGEVVQFTRARRSGEIDEYALPSKKITPDELSDNEVALNPISGERFTKDQINRNHTVFRLGDVFEEGDEDFRFLVFEQPKTRRLHHTDVLGYNPGGPRVQNTMKYTVKQEKPGGRPRTIIGTETSVQARTATNQINEILKAAREQIGEFAGLSRARKIDAIEELGDDLTDVVRRNNDFDPTIESIQEFAAFLRTQRIDPAENVGFARLNQQVVTENDAGDLVHLGGDTFEDLLEGGFNQPSSAGPRRDVPLRGFGNSLLETKSPIEAIQNDYMRVLHNRAFGSFYFQSVNGWLKGADGFITNKKQIAGMEPLRAMNAAEFVDKNLPEVRNLRQARQTINRVLNTKTGSEQFWDSLIDRVVDFTLQGGKIGRKVAKFADEKARDPATALRGFAFNFFLGLMAIPQLFVQASQIVNQLAIVGLRRTSEFFQAAVTHVPLRLALAKGDNPEFIREVGRRTKLFTGMEVDEFEQFARWVHDSGRLIIGGEVAEVSSDLAKASKSLLSKGLKVGRFPFEEGERVNRSTGLRLAWNEYKREFPNADVNSTHAVNWITARQNALTAAMTKASRSELQRGPQSVTFQFFTFSQRMKESLFTDRLLTKDERQRLAMAQFFFWGASGAGLGQQVDQVLTSGEVFGIPVSDDGVSMDDFTYTTLKYGLLNAVVNEAVGTQRVAFGERLAPAGQFADFMRKLGDNKFDEILGGPSVELIKDVWQRLPRVIMSIFSGNTTIAVNDTRRLMQNISSFNKAYQAWEIMHYGDYVSKNGNRVVSGLTETDAIMVFLGNQIQDADLTFSRSEILQSENEHIRTKANRLKELMLDYQRALQNNNPHDAEAIGNEIAKETVYLPPYAQRKVQRALEPQLRSMSEETLDSVRKQAFPNTGHVDRE